MKHWSLITNEPDLNRLYDEQITFAFRRGKNLKELLSNDDKVEKQTFKGMQRCENCAHCNNVIVGNVFTHPTKGTKISLKHTSTCDSKNVIYVIKRPCGKIYVGLTERKLKVCITEH